jgi:hypothetical protein
MKKRGQTPDAHTYTILFRGLADCAHYPQALSKALSIYHSMDAENAPVKPNVIHTNALLKVCARAKDMDAMLGVVAKLERKGLRAPSNLTFTTILNAIRKQAVEPGALLDEAQVRAIRRKAIMDARKLWVEIIARWHQGDIWIDEELTCSMGRILLIGEKQDVMDVFSLIEQTMNIPRMVSHDLTEDRNQLRSPLQVESVGRGERAIVLSDSTNPVVAYDEFQVVSPPKPLLGRDSAYAKPGRNSLSLVLEALMEVRMKRPLAEYWNVFTNVHIVEPDSPNYHSYLRNLRALRASSETVKILLQMPKSMLEKKTFRIAMAACVRDMNNQTCFSNAGKILDLMQQSLSVLDLPTLHKYMDIAIHASLYTGEASASGDGRNSLYARGRQILRALNRLGPCVINVRSALAYNQPPPPKIKEGSQADTDREAAFALVREMISAYDKLINHGLVGQDMHPALKRERSKLAAFVTRYTQKKTERAGSDVSKGKIYQELGTKSSFADDTEAEHHNGGLETTSFREYKTMVSN